VQKKVYLNNVLQSDTRFIYDGWNVVAEVDAAGAVTKRYVWGLDFSGTTQGAGGVGGLLMVGSGSATYLAAHDGRGNVTALVDAANGALSASYEYSPFGETLRESGAAAALNPWRFSSKFLDAETGLIQFNTRYYLPSQGRFIGRDSIGEQGGLNLYAYVKNDPNTRWDYLGMNDFTGVDMTPSRIRSDQRIPIPDIRPSPGAADVLRAGLVTIEAPHRVRPHDPVNGAIQMRDMVDLLGSFPGIGPIGDSRTFNVGFHLYGGFSFGGGISDVPTEPVSVAFSQRRYQFLIEASAARGRIVSDKPGDDREMSVLDYVNMKISAIARRLDKGSAKSISVGVFGSIDELSEGVSTNTHSQILFHGVNAGKNWAGGINLGGKEINKEDLESELRRRSPDDPSLGAFQIDNCGLTFVDINEIIDGFEEELIRQDAIRPKG
jgi:RHS repeat-associated protein